MFMDAGGGGGGGGLHEDSTSFVYSDKLLIRVIITISQWVFVARDSARPRP